METSLRLAVGGTANQGAIILLALLLSLLAVAVALCARVWWSRILAGLSGLASGISLLFATWTGYIFGLPYDWTYWGAYLPVVPLVLSLVALLLILSRKTPNQAMQRTAGRSAF